MLFAARALSVARDATFPQGYEDAFAFNSESGIAAVADGVSSAIFCSLWANILTKAVVGSPPDSLESDGFNRWLAPYRAEWLKLIDFPSLSPNQQVKVRRTGGASCTLTWVQLEQLTGPETPDRFALRAFGLGDSCLLQVRDGEVLTKFPLEMSQEFDNDPHVLGSVDYQRPVQFKSCEVECLAGDWIVLCTDAVAQWIYRRLESGEPVPWNEFWSFDESAWVAWIEELRQSSTIVRDDSTLLLLRLGLVVEDQKDSQDAEASVTDQATEPESSVPEQTEPCSKVVSECDSEVAP